MASEDEVSSRNGIVEQGKGMLANGIEDLEPTPNTAAARTWNWKVFSLAWASMVLNPASISAGAALLSVGLTPAEATLCHFIGAMILLVALQLNSWAGVKYGIPFPVLARSSFGINGAHFCTLTRGAVAVMWLSFQMWEGTLGICAAIERVFGHAAVNWGRLDDNVTLLQLCVLCGFALVHALMIWLGIERLRVLIYVVTPLNLLLFTGIAVWAATLSSFEDAMQSSPVVVDQTHTSHVVSWLIGITSSVAMWSTLVLNVCDLSRYCPSQRDQMIGQALGLPIPFTVTGFIGIWAAGATRHAFGVAMWQVPEYFQEFSPIMAVLSAIVLAGGIVVVDVLANLVSPINDLLNLAPNTFSFRYCGFACLVAAVLVCPWWTFSSQSAFVLTYLNGYGIITGGISGILLCDFWLIRKRKLVIEALYTASVGCQARNDFFGVNWRAFLALTVAVVPCLPGFVETLPGTQAQESSVWGTIYSVSWFFATIVSTAIYWPLCKLTAYPSECEGRQPKVDGDVAKRHDGVVV